MKFRERRFRVEILLPRRRTGRSRSWTIAAAFHPAGDRVPDHIASVIGEEGVSRLRQWLANRFRDADQADGGEASYSAEEYALILQSLTRDLRAGHFHGLSLVSLLPHLLAAKWALSLRGIQRPRRARQTTKFTEASPALPSTDPQDDSSS